MLLSRARGLHIGATSLLCLVGSVSSAQDVVTSFEFTNPGTFTLGSAPLTSTFSGGLAQSILSPGLYLTGMNSWMVPVGGTGTIQFDTPAERIGFSFRDQFASVNSVLTLFDTEGAVVTTLNGTTGWTLLDESAPVGGPYFDHVTLQHNGASGWTVIDDLAYFAVGGLGGSTVLPDPIPAVLAPNRMTVKLESVATGFVAPNLGVADPLGGDRLFVVDQPGTVWAVDLNTGTKTVFLDVSARLVPLGVFGPGTFDERGLLGLAFHPDYDLNGLLYTYTSEPESGPADFSTQPAGVAPDHQAVILEWNVIDPANPTSVVDPGSARELLRVDEPQFNHNAGCLGFGPDELLYIAFGDGGGADDTDGQVSLGIPMVGHGATGNGQNTDTVLGSILRIDPLGSSSTNGNYGIPLDNPFASSSGVDEIYAYGFRNPFRFSFDTLTGDLYVADVGQNDVEEINVVVNGGNYGWNLKEGSFFFDPNGLDAGYVTLDDPGVPASVRDPLTEYDHDEGISIIGGFLYRGSQIPELQGSYVFGDWSRNFFGNDGRLLTLSKKGKLREPRLEGMPDLGLSLQGFGQDAGGELYVLGNTTGVPSGSTGVLLRIAPSSRGPSPPVGPASNPVGPLTVSAK